MIAADRSQRKGVRTKLLKVGGDIQHLRFSDLGSFLSKGDALVVNTSGTMPSRFLGCLSRTGEKIEVRLGSFIGESAEKLDRWMAVSFVANDWRAMTEEKTLVQPVLKGDTIVISPDLEFEVEKVIAHRVLEIKVKAKNLESEMFRHGRPIQYSYMKDRLTIWDQQTLFFGRPISVEPPSATFALTSVAILQLLEKGVEIVPILHSAGLSSTGEKRLDEKLPFKEFSELSESSADSLQRVKDQGKKVFALGTSVFRAIESRVDQGKIVAGGGLTTLKVGAKTPIHCVDGLISGIHDLGTSHRELVSAFVPDSAILDEAYRQAGRRGYKNHEYGDLSLLVR